MFSHDIAASAAAPSLPRTRSRLATLGLATLAALGLTFGAATPALAHDVLVGQSFATDASDTTTGVVLHFNNEIMNIGAEIVITSPSGAPAAEGEPDISGRDVTQQLTQPLETDGTYAMVWRVVSSDGHPIQGELSFAVAEDGSAEFVAAEDEHDHDHDHAADDASDDASGDAGDTTNDAASPVDDGVMTTQGEVDNGGLSLGSLIAIGVVVVAIIGATIVAMARNKRQGGGGDAAATQSVDGNGGEGAGGGDAA